VSRYRIEPLQASHAVEAFDCGDEALNRFLIRFALANQRARASRTYVALAGDAVVGFHTLVVGEVSPEQAPERIVHPFLNPSCLSHWSTTPKASCCHCSGDRSCKTSVSSTNVRTQVGPWSSNAVNLASM
jgi:hypothetical protein